MSSEEERTTDSCQRHHSTCSSDFDENPIASPPFVKRTPVHHPTTSDTPMLPSIYASATELSPSPPPPRERRRRYKRARSWRHLKSAGTLHSAGGRIAEGVHTTRRTRPVAFSWSPTPSDRTDLGSISDTSTLNSLSSGEEADVERGGGPASASVFRSRQNANTDTSSSPCQPLSHRPPSSVLSPHSRRSLVLLTTSHSRAWTLLRVACLATCLYLTLWSDSSLNNPDVSPPATIRSTDLAAFSSQHGREIDFPSVSFSSQHTPIVQRVQSHEQHALASAPEAAVQSIASSEQASTTVTKRQPHLAYARASSHSAPLLGAAPILSQDKPHHMTRFVLRDDELVNDAVAESRRDDYYDDRDNDDDERSTLWRQLAWIVLAGVLFEFAYREAMQRCCRSTRTANTRRRRWSE